MKWEMIIVFQWYFFSQEKAIDIIKIEKGPKT